MPDQPATAALTDDWRAGGFALYVHWPFCAAKCPYCDFNSHVAAAIDQPRWLAAYRAEIARLGTELPGRVLNSIFFGGGTPSLMTPDTVAGVIAAAREAWPFANDIEITLEANPTSVETGRFRAFAEGGVNRVSMGVQALNDDDLRRLGRMHSVAEARAAFDIARDCFTRVSFDLIYARQDQDRAHWRRELSQALAKHPRVFSPFYLSMVRVGEATGMLEDVFYRLFEHLEFERYMREQVKSALRYPMFVVAAMIAAIVIVNLFVIPAFAKVFAGFGAELPLMTRLLLGFSGFMVEYWPLLLAVVVAAVFAFRAWVGTAAGRLAWDRITLRLPIAGKILHKAALSRFARSFALGQRSGVPVMQALSNAAQTVDNVHVARRIEAMRESVERGESLLRSAIGAGIFTPVVLQMVAVGEESGAVDDMMEEIGDMYRQEVEYELKTLGQQIEPILIVLLGILVLILALGIFLPMWDLGKVAIKR